MGCDEYNLVLTQVGYSGCNSNIFGEFVFHLAKFSTAKSGLKCVNINEKSRVSKRLSH